MRIRADPDPDPDPKPCIEIEKWREKGIDYDRKRVLLLKVMRRKMRIIE